MAYTACAQRDLGLVFYDHWLFLFFNNLEEVKIYQRKLMMRKHD